MVGSNQSISGPNFVINTMVADVLEKIVADLEKADDLNAATEALVKKVWKEHSKVVFNGNGYAVEWVDEAAKRGLPNINNTVDAVQVITEDKYVKLFESQNVLSEAELHAREEVLLEHYINTINIEALTMLEMANRDLLPAGLKYVAKLADDITTLKSLGVDISAQEDLLKENVFTMCKHKEGNQRSNCCN